MKTVAIVVVLVSATFVWAQSSTTTRGDRVGQSNSAKVVKKPLSPEQTVWCPVLEQALAGARSFEPPMRSYLLDATATGLGKCNSPKAGTALIDSFMATLSIPEKEEEISLRPASPDASPGDQVWAEALFRLQTKMELQGSALRHLSAVDERRAESLLEEAEPRVKDSIFAVIISRAVSAKNYDHALELLQRVSASAFPYGEATELMLALPPSRDVDRQEIFRLAMAADREHHTVIIGGDDFGSLIVRFWQHVPPAVALEAIHQVLDATQSKAETGITLNTASGNLGFTNEYDYRVFELMPILRQLDNIEADKILTDSQQVKSQLQQFPNGIQSLDPAIADTPPRKGEQAQIAGSIGPADRLGPTLTEANTTDAYNSRMREIAHMAEDNPRQAIAAAATLPEARNSPPFGAENLRAKALLAVAQAVRKKAPAAAKDALEEMADALKDRAPFYGEMESWAEGMRTATQMGEVDLALKLFRSGMNQAEQLESEDTDPDDPNLAPKAWWPSVTVAWQLVRAASQISPTVALESIQEIKDPEVLLLLEIRLANSKLGAPLNQSITMVQKRSSHRSWSEYRGREE